MVFVLGGTLMVFAVSTTHGCASVRVIIELSEFFSTRSFLLLAVSYQATVVFIRIVGG